MISYKRRLFVKGTPKPLWSSDMNNGKIVTSYKLESIENKKKRHDLEQPN